MYLTAVYVDDDVDWNFTEGRTYLIHTDDPSNPVACDDMGDEWAVIQTGYEFYTLYGKHHTPLAMFERCLKGVMDEG